MESLMPTWEQPIPFEIPILPPFPVDALPSKVKDYVLAVAESTQTPVDMAATAALTIMATCLQGKYKVAAKPDWIEPLNLYALMIAEPSERKSAIVNLMSKPMRAYEREYNIAHAADVEKSRMNKRILENKQKIIEGKVAKGHATDIELELIANELSSFKELRPLRLFADDITPEKLTSILAERNGIASIISAEGGIFDQLSGGMYSKTVNIDVFLKGHSGDCIRIDRIGRGSESVENPALTMLLAAQPSVIAGIMQNGTFRGRGLTARFLYTIPKSMVGSRNYYTKPIPAEAEQAYSELIYNLLDDRLNPTTDDPEIIILSSKADAELCNFTTTLEGKLRTSLDNISDWAGKLCGAIVRIAGILCRAEKNGCHKYMCETEPLAISHETICNAIHIGCYYLKHAKAAYSIMGADPVIKKCKAVLKAITQNQHTEISKREIMRLCRSIKTVEELQPALDELCEYGYIQCKQEQGTKANGRPTQLYYVNPLLYEN